MLTLTSHLSPLTSHLSPLTSHPHPHPHPHPGESDAIEESAGIARPKPPNGSPPPLKEYRFNHREVLLTIQPHRAAGERPVHAPMLIGLHMEVSRLQGRTQLDCALDSLELRHQSGLKAAARTGRKRFAKLGEGEASQSSPRARSAVQLQLDRINRPWEGLPPSTDVRVRSRRVQQTMRSRPVAHRKNRLRRCCDVWLPLLRIAIVLLCRLPELRELSSQYLAAACARWCACWRALLCFCCLRRRHLDDFPPDAEMMPVSSVQASPLAVGHVTAPIGVARGNDERV